MRGARLSPDGSAFVDDVENIDQRLDVIHHRGFAEQSELRRERWLRSRLTAFAFDRIKQRGLLAANICAAAPAKFDVECEGGSRDSRTEVTCCQCLRDRTIEGALGLGIFTPDVNEPTLRAGRNCTNRH